MSKTPKSTYNADAIEPMLNEEKPQAAKKSTPNTNEWFFQILRTLDIPEAYQYTAPGPDQRYAGRTIAGVYQNSAKEFNNNLRCILSGVPNSWDRCTMFKPKEQFNTHFKEVAEQIVDKLLSLSDKIFDDKRQNNLFGDRKSVV